MVPGCWHVSCGGGVALLVANSCAQATSSPGSKLAESHSIHFPSSAPSNIESFQTNVRVYQSNDRIANSRRLLQTYRLSIKSIDGRICTRIDSPGDDKTGISPRSVIIDGKEIAMLDTLTGKIESRAPAPSAAPGSPQSESGRYLFKKIDSAQALANYRAAACAISGEGSGKIAVISAPSGMLRSAVSGSAAPSSFKLFLDLENGTLAGSESISAESDGTVVTAKITRLFEESKGSQIPIGIVQDVHYAKPKSLDVSDRMFSRVDDLSTVPVISKEKLDALKAAGNLVIAAPLILGDPADASYTETTITYYDDISLNSASDSLFKIP